MSLLIAAMLCGGSPQEGARVVEFFGYNDCIELTNDSTRVVLCPAAGGRVLVYAINGKNALYLPPRGKGFHWDPQNPKRGAMDAGRFDIGPEQLVPKRPALWMGPWKGEITAARTARLTSVKDEATGVQLVREFVLSPKSSRLKVSQTIVNVSDEPKEYCHWSRTFALGGGTVVIPTSARSRFPEHYVMYENGSTMNFRPSDPNITKANTHLAITAAPKFPKLGMDSQAGWFLYLMREDMMFAKTFKVSPDRHYNEVAGLTVSIWYPDQDRIPTVELEPIGPAEKLQPGESATFTETWYLLPHKYPGQDSDIQLRPLAEKLHAVASKPE